jgi:hypothetical protein
MFFKDIEELMYDLFMESSSFWGVVGPNSDVIHIIHKIVGVFLFEWFKISILGSLEDRWGVAESEGHVGQNKSS